jgi:Protein of unknown function (DUF3631)
MSRCDFQAQLKSPLKAVGRHHYVHLDGFDFLPAEATARLVAAESLAQISRSDRYNVARFNNSHNRVALLNYPSFFEDAFPALRESWNVDLTPGRVSYRNYRDSLTPPILHRKELMLPEDHPRRAEFQALTETAEAIGLFEDSTRIGFREQWLRLVREKGYQIVGHDLIPIANDEATDARKALRWASDNAHRFRGADPDIPAGIFNRVADNWRPLLAIADAAGGEWPKRARHVLAMMAGATTGDQSAGVLVLADIRNIFGERREDRLPSTELAEALVAIEGRPWAEWRHGKPITANGLARLLEPFRVAPTTIRVGTKTPKGYRLSDFADAFERYLTPDAQEGASEPQHRNKADEMGTSTTSATATAAPLLRFENAKKPNNDGQCCGVAVANPGEAHCAHLETRCDHCGQPATSADPLHPWDWPGRPDGIWLHSRCEAAWIDYGKSVSPLAAEADMLDIPAFLRRSAAGGSPVA